MVKMSMRRRSFLDFYKTYEIEKMSSLDRKRFMYLNEFGFNIDSSKRKTIDYDMQIKRHRNSESK